MSRIQSSEALPLTNLSWRAESPRIEQDATHYSGGYREERRASQNARQDCPSGQMPYRRSLSRTGTRGNTGRHPTSQMIRTMGTLVLPPHLYYTSPEGDSESAPDAPSIQSNTLPIEHRISQIVDDMDENPLPKQVDTLRDMLESLTLKRQVKARLMCTETERSNQHPISLWKRVKYRISMSCKKAKETLRGLLYSLELWYSGLKTIEGHLGSSVATYFKFLRWLFLLNSVILTISLSFLVTPQILMRFFENYSASPAPERIIRDEYYEKKFPDSIDLNGSAAPPIIAAPLLHKSNPYGENVRFSLGNVFTGEGFFTHTSLYYGYYSNGSLELVNGYNYNIPNAYFFSMFFCYLLVFFTLSASMARSYRASFIETRGGQNNIYALKLFCGWDFSIATEEAASLNQKRIYNEIKAVLDETRHSEDESGLLPRFTTVAVQLSLNVVFLLVLAGTGLLMWDLLGRHSAYLVAFNQKDTDRTANYTMLMSIFITVIMNIFPMGFSWIVRYEDYRSPRTALYVTLLRTFLLNVVVVGVLLLFWLKNSPECWETSLGQEVYRLIVSDFIISILVTGIAETVCSKLSKKTCFRVSQAEFDISRNTLNLIYNQALFWVGFYFSPLLAVVIVVKLFITFHVKKAGALHNCQTLSHSWRAAQTQTVFLILTFITLLGVLIVYGYILVQVPASDCGPFRAYPYMYQMILEGILKLQRDHLFWKLLMYAVKPGVVGGLLVAMSVAAYYLRAKSQAHSTMVGILRHMLVLEARDKEFLLKSIDNVDRIYRRNGSPAVSQSSSFRTPLATRLNKKTELLERDSMRLSLISARRQGTQDWLAAERLHVRWLNERSSSRNSLQDEVRRETNLLDNNSQPSSSSDVSRKTSEYTLSESEQGHKTLQPF